MNLNYSIAYLALEERPNSYIPIDLTTLDIFKEKESTFELAKIDAFTKKYSEAEIRAAIIRSNTIDQSKSDAPLVVVNKYKMPVLTKDTTDEYTITKLISLIIEDKQLINKYINKYNSIISKSTLEVENLFIKLKDELYQGNVNGVSKLFLMLPYLNQRELYFYIIEAVEQYNIEKENKLKRAKKENKGDYNGK